MVADAFTLCLCWGMGRARHRLPAAIKEHKALSTSPPNGSLACVGIGITLGSHITPLARSHIQTAEVVFAVVSDGIVELWLKEMHADVRSLQPLYAEGKRRTQTYREMVEAILAEVRAGRRVCAVFYGHPGVFAWAPHRAIKLAREEGYRAHMEPGISSEDCLYADLGIDPGSVGCQHFDTTQFMLYRRTVDPSAWLILWQVGLAGEHTGHRFATGAAQRRVLLDVLARDYPPDHEAIVYRAAMLPVQAPRMERLPLSRLLEIDLNGADTLAIPPARALQPDDEVLARLAALDQAVPA